MHYTIASLKGGVGKTTTAVFLAHAAAARGESVLIVDADTGQNSAARWSEITPSWPHERITVVGWSEHKTLAKRVRDVSDNYDMILVDCGPKIRGLLYAAIAATGNLIVPCTPASLDVADIGPTCEIAAEVAGATGREVTTRILLTKVRARTRSAAFVRDGLIEHGYDVMAASVPLKENLTHAFGFAPFYDSHIESDSTTPYADVLAELTDKEPING